MAGEYFFGIDFGTTNSALFQYFSTGSQLYSMQFGDSSGKPQPSVVAVNNETGEILTGKEAATKRNQLSDSFTYFPSIKMILDDDSFEIEVAGRVFDPIDIASEVFKAMINDVELYGNGQKLEKATVSIPVGFSAKKRRHLREAAELAGIKIESFVSEPTAAFFANYKYLAACSNVVVFDWGGGTLDVSVLRHRNNDIYEIGSAGLEKAGDYIDTLIARKVHSTIAQQKELAIAFEELPHKTKDELLQKVEFAKCNLSSVDESPISFLSYANKGPARFNLSASILNDLLENLVDEAENCMLTAISQACMSVANIDRIIMVGGSSNLRSLKKRFEGKYGSKLYYPKESDAQWNIAQGAAMLSMDPGEYKINQSVGLVLSDGSSYELLSEGTTIGDSERTTHFALTDLSNEIRLVFTGSSDINQSSMKYKTINLKKYGFLEEQVIIHSRVDEDLIFCVSAKSSMEPTEGIWEYQKLKFYYHLPIPMM